MCALKSRGMSAVCTWGLRGIFFLTLVLFMLFALLCGRTLSYVCRYRTISKTLNFMLKYELRACAYGTYDHLLCAKAKKKVLVPVQ
jgi:hypothetical protein